MRWMFGFKWYRDFNRRLVADFLYFRRLLLRRRLSLTSRDYVWTDHVGHFDGGIRALGHQGIVRVQRHPSQHLHMKRMADPAPVIDNKLPVPAEGDACKPCKHQGNHCNHCNHCNHNHPNDSGASRNVFTTSSLTPITAEQDSGNEIWDMYLDEVKEDDKRISDAWKEDSNGILVFVSPNLLTFLFISDELQDRPFLCNCWRLYH